VLCLYFLSKIEANCENRRHEGPAYAGRKLMRRAADALEPDGDEGRDNLR
jgi:hypothetical protein